jgi:hypothetical protein
LPATSLAPARQLQTFAPRSTPPLPTRPCKRLRDPNSPHDSQASIFWPELCTYGVYIINVKGWQVRYGRCGAGGGELGDVSHYWEMGGSISGGVAVYDGHNGIMAFGTNLLGPRSVPPGNFYIDSCV